MTYFYTLYRQQMQADYILTSGLTYSSSRTGDCNSRTKCRRRTKDSSSEPGAESSRTKCRRQLNLRLTAVGTWADSTAFHRSAPAYQRNQCPVSNPVSSTAHFFAYPSCCATGATDNASPCAGAERLIRFNRHFLLFPAICSARQRVIFRSENCL